MKILKYIHPSVSKYDITKTYTLQELQSELSDEMIKVMFSPINFEWEEKKEISKKIVDKEVE
jgi:hypothetical protein